MLTTSTPTAPDYSLRLAIAGQLLGEVTQLGSQFYVACPGAEQHTTPNGRRDCRLYLAGAPTLDCVHGSCEGAIAAANLALRQAVGRAEWNGHEAGLQPLHLTYTRPEPPPPPVYNEAKLRAVAGDLVGVVNPEWLWARSPLLPEVQTPASFLRRLYRPGEHVVVMDNQRACRPAPTQAGEPALTLWRHVEEPYDSLALDGFRTGRAGGVWYLIQPVDGALRPKVDGDGQSYRSEANVTRWAYLLLESDAADAAQWLAALARLPLAIVAIYTSGGRSIHALVRVDAASKKEWDAIRDRLRPALVTLGADAAAMSAVRLSRLPGCRREEKDAEQRLLFLNPDADNTPLAELPVLRRPADVALRWTLALLQQHADDRDSDELAAVREVLALHADDARTIRALALLNGGAA